MAAETEALALLSFRFGERVFRVERVQPVIAEDWKSPIITEEDLSMVKEVKIDIEVESEYDPQVYFDTKSEAKPDDEAKSETKPDVKSESEPEDKCHAEIEIKLNAEMESKPDHEIPPKPDSVQIETKLDAETGSKANAEIEAKPNHEIPPKPDGVQIETKLVPQDTSESDASRARKASAEPQLRFKIIEFEPAVAWKQKKQRRKFEDVKRRYCCQVKGCNKAYGELSHLRLHTRIKHPQSNKEIVKTSSTPHNAPSREGSILSTLSPQSSTPSSQPPTESSNSSSTSTEDVYFNTEDLDATPSPKIEPCPEEKSDNMIEEDLDDFAFKKGKGFDGESMEEASFDLDITPISSVPLELKAVDDLFSWSLVKITFAPQRQTIRLEEIDTEGTTDDEEEMILESQNQKPGENQNQQNQNQNQKRERNRTQIKNRNRNRNQEPIIIEGKINKEFF